MSVALLTTALVVLAVVRPGPFAVSHTGRRAATKPYASFGAFYPFYLSEHSEWTNRVLHVCGTSLVVLMLALHPVLAHAMVSALAVGCLLATPLAGLRNGLAEMAAMVGVFLAHAHAHDHVRQGLLTLITGYAFAWVGHFFFQNNRPATFVYPAYSLLGDARMWAETVTAPLLTLAGVKAHARRK